MGFDIDSFLTGLKKDETKARDKKDQLNRVLMNVKDNQGLLTMLPVMSRSTNVFYYKVSKVYEYYGITSVLDSGEAWYKVAPIEFYGELTPDQIGLYSEVKGYLDTLQAKEVGFVENYGQFRIRNYTLLTGILKSLKNTEGAMNSELVDCPCLFVYPSNSVIDALGTAINNKIDAMQGRKDWIPYILNPNSKGYKGVLQVDFKKKAAQAGYESTISFELNSEFNKVVDPEYEVSEKILNLFNNPMRVFFGWNYDSDNNRPFNEVQFKELRDQLKQRVQLLDPSTPEPTSSSNNTAPAANAETAQESKRTPF